MMTILLNDTLFAWVLLIDSAAKVKTLIFIDERILLERSVRIDLSSVPIEFCRGVFILFLVIKGKRLWWWIFFTKILLLLRRHYACTLIISLLVVYLIVRIPGSTSLCILFCGSSVHRVEDLNHIWCLWMVSSFRDRLSDFNLIAILRPI